MYINDYQHKPCLINVGDSLNVSQIIKGRPAHI